MPVQSIAADTSIERGRTLVMTCGGCHDKGNRSIPGFESLNEQQIFATLKAYKLDQLTGTVMNRIAKGYSDEDLRLIAEFAND